MSHIRDYVYSTKANLRIETTNSQTQYACDYLLGIEGNCNLL